MSGELGNWTGEVGFWWWTLVKPSNESATEPSSYYTLISNTVCWNLMKHVCFCGVISGTNNICDTPSETHILLCDVTMKFTKQIIHMMQLMAPIASFAKERLGQIFSSFISVLEKQHYLLLCNSWNKCHPLWYNSWNKYPTLWWTYYLLG